MEEVRKERHYVPQGKGHLKRSEETYFYRCYKTNFVRNIPFYTRPAGGHLVRSEKTYFKDIGDEYKLKAPSSYKGPSSRHTGSMERSSERQSKYFTPEPPNIFKTAVQMHLDKTKKNTKKPYAQSFDHNASGVTYSDKNNPQTYNYNLGSRIEEETGSYYSRGIEESKDLGSDAYTYSRDENTKEQEYNYNRQKTNKISEEYYDDDYEESSIEEDYYSKQNQMSEFYDCDSLFVVMNVQPNSVGSNAGLVAGDQIVAVNGYTSKEVDGKTKAATELRKMVNATTKMIIKRGFKHERMEMYVTKHDPCGFLVADYEGFLRWMQNVTPISKVRKVNEYSPADIAGLQVGDEIVWSADITNKKEKQNGQSKAFLDLLSAIKAHKNKKMVMYIKRMGDVFQTVVSPSEWKGNGLTGMTITAM